MAFEACAGPGLLLPSAAPPRLPALASTSKLTPKLGLLPQGQPQDV